jgi:hypothetical protein
MVVVSPPFGGQKPKAHHEYHREVTPNSAVAVGPRLAVLRNGALAFVIGGVPLFGVLIWRGAVYGTLALAIGTTVVCVLAAALCGWRYLSRVVEVVDGRLREVGFFSRRSQPVDAVARVVIAETDESSSAETVTQLLALGHDGRRLLRMRGPFWSKESMHAVADALGAPIQIEASPMSPKQFFAKYTSAAYWYEGRPWLAVLGISVASVAAFGVVTFMIAIAGSGVHM